MTSEDAEVPPHGARPLVDRIRRAEARTTLRAKLLATLALTLVAALALGMLAGVEAAQFRRAMWRTLLDAAILLPLLALLTRRSRRLAGLVRHAVTDRNLPAPVVPLDDARDEFLVIEREVRELARELSLGSRQQAVVGRLASLIRTDGDGQDALDFVVGQVAADLGVEHAAVVEWDAATRRLTTRAATGAASADLVAEVLLARPGLVEDALSASGAAQLLPSRLGTVLVAPVAEEGLGSLLVAVGQPGRDFGDADHDYLGGVSRALLILQLHGLRRDELAETESRFRAMVEHVPGVLYARLPTVPPVTTFVSDRVEDLLGTPASEWIEDPELWVRRLHPDDRERVVQTVTRAFEEEDGYECEYRLSHADGEWRWLLDSAAVVRDDNGAAVVVQGLVVDVTREREIEAALAQEQGRLAAIVEASPIIIVSVDADGINRYVSSAVYPTTGRRAEDLVDQSAVGHIHPDDVGAAAAAHVDLVAGRRARAQLTYRYQHVGGHWLTIDARGEPQRDAQGQVVGVVWALTDVTETVGMATQLRDAKEAAERANVAKSEFLSRMSHELRTPMNAVLGFAQLLELEPLSEDGQESVDQILRAGGHLLDLIDEVLDISRIEAGRLNVTLEPVLLRDVAVEVLDLLRPAAERQQVDLQLRGDVEGAVVADPQRFKQVVLNVVGNAVKYNRPGGQVVVAAAPVQANGGPMVRLTVQDTGRGIPADRLERVFVPFDRLGAEESGVEGTGLGLALSHRLIEVMGGVLGVESTVGVGSTFWIDLPRAEPDQLRTVLGEQVTVRRRGRVLRGRVLYIEDNLSNLRLVERLLGRHPEVDLLSAMQGTIGIQLADDHVPDLILLDLNLPDLDGDVVLERLRANPETADIPVVIISADATPRQVDRLKELGAQAYLTKPIDVPTFIETVGELLEQRIQAGGRP